MSKIAATSTVAPPLRLRIMCTAVSALALLAPAATQAAAPEPALRASEQLDARRIGRVSEDERAVLRVEWRAALGSVDEARSMDKMLDSLRRMEDTVAEISRLITTLPAPRTAPAATPVEARETGTSVQTLALGAVAAVVLLALYWLFRRKPVSTPATVPAIVPAPDSSPRDPAPLMAAPVAGVFAATPATAEAPAAPSQEPVTAAVATLVAAAPPPEAPAAAVVAPRPTLVAPAPTSPPPPAAPVPADAVDVAIEASQATALREVDFSLEDEDPEAIARANARIPVPRKPNPDPHVPERRQEIVIEPTLQLAEIMLSMGLAQGAAQALIEYTDANPRQAVYHWLKLLAIYRDSGQRKDFEETAERLRKFFNIQAAGTAGADPGEPPTLERFPRIAEQVEKLWSRPEECLDYLRHLLEDNRDGSRIGFPQSVAEEFLLLIEILKTDAGARQGDA